MSGRQIPIWHAVLQEIFRIYIYINYLRNMKVVWSFYWHAIFQPAELWCGVSWCVAFQVELLSHRGAHLRGVFRVQNCWWDFGRQNTPLNTSLQHFKSCSRSTLKHLTRLYLVLWVRSLSVFVPRCSQPHRCKLHHEPRWEVPAPACSLAWTTATAGCSLGGTTCNYSFTFPKCNEDPAIDIS